MVGLDALASLVGASLGSVCLGRAPCECRCSAEHDAALVSLLRDQLARCGPEQLRSTPCSCSPCPDDWDGWHVALFALGFVVGLLAAVVALGVVYVCWASASAGGGQAQRRPVKTETEVASAPLVATHSTLRRALLP